MTATKYYGIFDDDGKLVRDKLYRSAGPARNLLSRWLNYWPERASWTVKEISTITTQPVAARKLDLRRQTYERHNWRTNESELVETRPATSSVDVVTNTNIVRVTVEGDVQYLSKETIVYN